MNHLTSLDDHLTVDVTLYDLTPQQVGAATVHVHQHTTDDSEVELFLNMLGIEPAGRARVPF